LILRIKGQIRIHQNIHVRNCQKRKCHGLLLFPLSSFQRTCGSRREPVTLQKEHVRCFAPDKYNRGPLITEFPRGASRISARTLARGERIRKVQMQIRKVRTNPALKETRRKHSKRKSVDGFNRCQQRRATRTRNDAESREIGIKRDAETRDDPTSLTSITVSFDVSLRWHLPLACTSSRT